MSSFQIFSYFEFSLGDNIYVSAFPSVDTQCPPDDTITVNSLLFPLDTIKTLRSEDLKIFLSFLTVYHFGFNDYIGYLIPAKSRKESYTADEIIQHLSTLTVTKIVESNEYDIVIAVSSTVFPEEVQLRVHYGSLPQKAVDVSVYFLDPPRICTTLGYKRKSAEVKIDFNGQDNVALLSVGKFGYLYGAGEHVEAKTEGKAINDLLALHAAEVSTPTGFVLYKEVDVISNRSLLEELGVTPSRKAKYFVYGVHNRKGRDPRYVSLPYTHNGTEYTFGYDRESESVLIAVLVKGTVPTSLPDPGDIVEVQKPRLIPLQSLAGGFKTKGQYPPAFEAHEEQFQILLAKLPAMIDAYDQME